MKKIILIAASFLSIFCTTLFLAPKIVLANCVSVVPGAACPTGAAIRCTADGPTCCSVLNECSSNDIPTISDLESVIGNVVRSALGLAGIVLFVLLLVGGFKFITSGGDPKAVESAKNTLTHAIIGLVIILASYLVLVLIKELTGVDVTNFSVTLP